MRGPLALGLAVLAAAPAASADQTRAEATLARATAGRTAGAPVDCIQRRRTDDFKVAGSRLIFRMTARLTYVGELSPGCDVGLPRQALVFRSTSSQLCRGEIVQSVDPLGGAAGGSCTIERFVPYVRP